MFSRTFLFNLGFVGDERLEADFRPLVLNASSCPRAKFDFACHLLIDRLTKLVYRLRNQRW